MNKKAWHVKWQLQLIVKQIIDKSAVCLNPKPKTKFGIAGGSYKVKKYIMVCLKDLEWIEKQI